MKVILLTMVMGALCCGFPADLTDAQIQEAIQDGANRNMHGLLDKCYRVSFKGALNRQFVFVLSDSDRVALAARAAANAKHKQDRHKLSVQDARATAIKRGVVTVLFEALGSTSIANRNPGKKLENYVSSLQIMLKVDDKIIHPLTRAEYSASASGLEPWDFRLSIDRGCVDYGGVRMGGDVCYWAVFGFPAIEGAQKLKMIVVSGDGTSKEEEVDPKQFGSH